MCYVGRKHGYGPRSCCVRVSCTHDLKVSRRYKDKLPNCNIYYFLIKPKKDRRLLFLKRKHGRIVKNLFLYRIMDTYIHERLFINIHHVVANNVHI